MKVLVCEWITGGGGYVDQNNNPAAGFDAEMLAMGQAMLEAVAADFLKFADVDVLWDRRLAPLQPETTAQAYRATGTHSSEVLPGARARQQFDLQVHPVNGATNFLNTLAKQADQADQLLLIAPETGQRLESCVRAIGKHESKLISPNLEFVQLTSDKNRLFDYLRSRGFQRIAAGMPLEQFLVRPSERGHDWFPLVVKPFDGAGSDSVMRFEKPHDVKNFGARLQRGHGQEALQRFRVEQFVAGIPASVSVINTSRRFFGSDSEANLSVDRSLNLVDRLSGIDRLDRQAVILPPLRQVFKDGQLGNYVESVDDLPAHLAQRAAELARSIVPLLPRSNGYFGIDLVLSHEGERQDVLIEINPRLTMSYPRLSNLRNWNLAFLMG